MARITGRVVRDGQPLADAYVRLIGPSGEFTGEVYTKDDGAFEFHVVEGTWQVHAQAKNAETATQTVQVADEDATVEVELNPTDYKTRAT